VVEKENQKKRTAAGSEDNPTPEKARKYSSTARKQNEEEPP